MSYTPEEILLISYVKGCWDCNGRGRQWALVGWWGHGWYPCTRCAPARGVLGLPVATGVEKENEKTGKKWIASALIDGAMYRTALDGELGQLEAPPLHDSGDLPPSQAYTTGILWIPHSGDDAERWVYVKAGDLIPAEEAEA